MRGQRRHVCQPEHDRARATQPARAGLPITVPTDWSPERALAVFEILDELRDRVWARYGQQIQHILREQRCTASSDASGEIDEADVPF